MEHRRESALRAATRRPRGSALGAATRRLHGTVLRAAEALGSRDWVGLVLLGLLGAVCFLGPMLGLLNDYQQLLFMYAGINVILCVSLNLVNGYMGEFSIGHAGFMAVGAYASSLLTVRALPEGGAWLCPIAVVAGGAAAAIAGLVIAIPSFRTRGDYLAIVTLAFTMIVKSALENLEWVGGGRGLAGMRKLTTLPWVFVWTLLAVATVRNLVHSRFGRAILAIREDELAGLLSGIETRRVKLIAFTASAFLAGTAGALYAHLVLFITPRGFDLLKSTDVLIMVYLGGIGSILGSILGAVAYTGLLELLRPLGVWRMVCLPLLLVLLMVFRPRGILGLRELPWLVPRRDRDATRRRAARAGGGREGPE
jgi:branched-chain amino acid transport system permease protein